MRAAFGWARRLNRRRKGDEVRERIEGNGFGRAQLRVASEDAPPFPLAGRGTTKIAIGIRDVGFHQEVQDFIGRDPRFEIVGAAVDGDRLVSVLSERGPDAAVLCPTLARELRHPALQGAGRSLVVVAEEMTVPVLREAIEAGAAAVFSWPEERDELARSLSRMRARAASDGAKRGTVIAVHAARGGAGATFVATHLAAATAGRGLRTVLVDLDVALSDVSAALGIPPDEGLRTALDLVPVMDELSPEHLEDALYRHGRGFAALLAPADPEAAPEVRPGLYRGAVALLAADHDVVVLHLPRALDRVARAGVELADRMVVVTTLDMFSLYGAKRTMAVLARDVPRDRWWVVLNKPTRSGITAGDVERVLGVAARARIRFDARVVRAQERGELLPERSGGFGRDLRKLATMLVDNAIPPTQPAPGVNETAGTGGKRR